MTEKFEGHSFDQYEHDPKTVYVASKNIELTMSFGSDFIIETEEGYSYSICSVTRHVPMSVIVKMMQMVGYEVREPTVESKE